ncbi:unnamed protein product [Lampetra planeri]
MGAERSLRADSPAPPASRQLLLLLRPSAPAPYTHKPQLHTPHRLQCRYQNPYPRPEPSVPRKPSAQTGVVQRCGGYADEEHVRLGDAYLGGEGSIDPRWDRVKAQSATAGGTVVASEAAASAHRSAPPRRAVPCRAPGVSSERLICICCRASQMGACKGLLLCVRGEGGTEMRETSRAATAAAADGDAEDAADAEASAAADSGGGVADDDAGYHQTQAGTGGRADQHPGRQVEGFPGTAISTRAAPF